VGRQILSMQRIDKRFTGVHALRNVDFDLEEGEIHALVGENGAGKSTLMKVLIGINPKDSGEIHYLGSSTPATRSTPWRWGSASSTRS
jgi:ribose transport system ATP-binding protein